MRGLRRRFRLLKRNERGAAIVEFALVVPIFFLLVWAGLVLSRAYQRLGVLKGALREGARVAATFDAAGLTGGTAQSLAQSRARERVRIYAAGFGFSASEAAAVSAAVIVVGGVTNEVTVSVTNYPLFADLIGFNGIDAMLVSDTAVFRWERSP